MLILKEINLGEGLVGLGALTAVLRLAFSPVVADDSCYNQGDLKRGGGTVSVTIWPKCSCSLFQIPFRL